VLPSELKAQERTRLAVDLARAIAERHRCAVDVFVHRPGRGGDTRNHHTHLFCTTRRLTAEGFKDKTCELDDAKTGEVLFWRERWARLTNERLKERGLKERIDHRTLEAQGIERTPGVHKGPLLTALELRGNDGRVLRRLEDERALEVQVRLERAAELGRLEREREEVGRSILVFSTDIVAARQERDRAAAAQARAANLRPAPQGRSVTLEQWRGEVRRNREAAKEKSREGKPARGRDKERDGPENER